MSGTDWQATAREHFDSVLLNIALAWKAEQEKWTPSVQAGAREQFSGALNLGLRRLRTVTTIEETAVLTVELVSGYAEKVAFFLFGEGSARAQAMRNLGQEPVEFSPNEAAAFQTAIETQDPVIAMGTPPEISAILADRLGTETIERVFLYPMKVHGGVNAVLLAAGNVQAATLELITGLAAIRMEALTHTPHPSSNGLVNIARIPPPNEWNELTQELQKLHLKAQRRARLRVAEMQIEHSQAVHRGRGKADLYKELQQPIDTARDEFRKEFLAASPTMVDYLYLELIRGLAQGDDTLLGASFPGPLV